MSQHSKRAGRAIALQVGTSKHEPRSDSRYRCGFCGGSSSPDAFFVVSQIDYQTAICEQCVTKAAGMVSRAHAQERRP